MSSRNYTHAVDDDQRVSVHRVALVLLCHWSLLLRHAVNANTWISIQRRHCARRIYTAVNNKIFNVFYCLLVSTNLVIFYSVLRDCFCTVGRLSGLQKNAWRDKVACVWIRLETNNDKNDATDVSVLLS